MISRIAKFHKVSFEQFKGDWEDTFGKQEDIRSIYEDIRLPERATSGSAGYDFFAPKAFVIQPGETVKIPTGIRAEIDEGWVLALFPRSSLGFKYRLQLNNTVGIIDKITNDSNEDKTLELPKGAGVVQGIFLPFGITLDDASSGQRNGGFGSTDKGRN